MSALFAGESPTQQGVAMPRRRPKTRVDRLVDALEALDRVSSSLNEVDLRTTSGELRSLVKASRERSRELGELLTSAVRADAQTLAIPGQSSRTAQAV